MPIKISVLITNCKSMTKKKIVKKKKNRKVGHFYTFKLNFSKIATPKAEH